MSQGWNRQFQNIQRLINEYANAINLRDQGFQLGESSNLRRPGNFTLGETGSMKTGKTVPTVYQQPKVQPQAALPGRSTISLPASQKPLLLTTSGKPLPNQQAAINVGGDAGQVAYKLPNGTYTSNPDLVNIAKQQTARAKDIAARRSMARQLIRDTRGLAKGAKAGGITGAISIPAAVLAHKDAYKYYNDMMKDESLPGEWRQIANALRLKEAMAMGIEGPGTAIGTGLGALLGRGNKWAMLAGGAIPEALGRPAGAMADHLLQPAIDKYNFPVYNGGIKLGSFNFGGKDNGNNKGGNKKSTSQSAGVNSVKGGGKMGGQPTTQQQALALAQQLGDNTPITNQQDADTQQTNINAINDYISKLQEINQPYIESLQRFADNYGDLYNQNQLYNRRMRDLSAITGSPLWYQSAKDYNPLEVEATKIDLQKKIQDAQAGDLNAINEIMGNLAMAQEMGLSPEAAFANKNLLTAMTMRDRNLTNREIAQLNNAAKLQIALQNAQNRLAVQNLRNQGGMTNALIYAGQYGQPAPGLNQHGAPSNVPASYDVMLQSAHNKNNR